MKAMRMLDSMPTNAQRGHGSGGGTVGGLHDSLTGMTVAAGAGRAPASSARHPSCQPDAALARTAARYCALGAIG